MSPGQLPRRVPRLSNRPEYLSVRVEFHYPVIPPINHPDVLVRSDEETVGVADARPFLQEISVCVEYLNAFVLAIPDVDVSLTVHRDAVRQIEFARPASIFPPSLQKFPSRSNFITREFPYPSET